MKKIFSLVLILTLLLSLSVTSAAADEPRLNVFNLDTVYPYHYIGINPTGAYIPEYVYDGNIDYDKSNSGTFCDHRLTASQKEVQQGKALLYDLSGIPDSADAKYLCVLFFELDQVYTLDGFSFYCSDAPNGIPSNINVDGVDILLSETGQDGEWTLVYSETELHCGKKYQVHSGLYEQTAYITADFEETKAQYIAFGLTQPRCLHADALKAAYGQEVCEHPEYFRITELEFYGNPADIAETTAQIATPAVTEAPTAQLPAPATLNYEAILVTVLLLGMTASALLVAKQIRKTGADSNANRSG